MLDRFRKRIGNLLSGGSTTEEAPPPVTDPPVPTQQAPPAASELEAVVLARREARKREARLVLSERIYNRAATLKIELRNRLLREIQDRLQEETGSQNLQELLQVALDPAFTLRLDKDIDEQVASLVQNLQESFRTEQSSPSFFPSADELAGELKAYRDQLLRAHMLEQIDVFALPSLTGAFPKGKVPAEQLQQKIAAYWASCAEALDRFFHSVEMALLNGARPGIRLDPTLIRERLLAAQYRNGYRALEDRFRSFYSELANLQLNSPERAQKEKPQNDRQVVDEVIVPLAYFIRSRSEAEPKEALRSRAELLREIVDKLIASGDPYQNTAEAIKPLLRRSIEQARPLAVAGFPFLRSAIDSLKPAEVHRATALAQLLEVLLQPEINERSLQAVEQSVRLDKWQYHLHLQLWRNYPAQLLHLQPLERIDSEDSEFLRRFIEAAAPTPGAVEDMAVQLGYLEPPATIPDDPRELLRVLAVLTLPREELSTWSLLYASDPPSDADLKRFSKSVIEQLRSTSVGADDRQQSEGAVPFPVELPRALAAMGYKTDERDKLAAFTAELESLIVSGAPQELATAIELIRKLKEAVEKERESLGLVGTEGDPYVSEVWLKDSGTMVGLLFYRGKGFGEAPTERVTRDPTEGKTSEINQQLRRHLASQAIIYQAFYRLFARAQDLPHSRRMGLPAYLKTIYENIEPRRHTLLAHLKNAQLLVKRIGEFAEDIGEADPKVRSEATRVGQILAGLAGKTGEIQKTVEGTKDSTQLSRLAREHERVVRYINVVILHSINPWLQRQTKDLATEFDFREEDVLDAVRASVASHGLDWKNDVKGLEAHRIHGTLGCRGLLQLVDGSSKVVLLEYDRRRQNWQVTHYGPRITDVVEEELQRHGRSLPSEYDEKYEQPTFSLQEQSCRFMLNKRGTGRAEATLILDPSQNDRPWKVVFLKWNDEVLINRVNPLEKETASA
jgi:hypothetical protein